METTLLGQILKKQRLNAGLSLKEVAPKLGIDYTYLSKVENGKRKPSQAITRDLCRLYHTDFDIVMAAVGILPPDVANLVKLYGKETFDLLRKSYGGLK